MSLLPTKLLMSWEDIGADHSDVPAMFVMFLSCASHFLKGLMHSADKNARRHLDLLVPFGLELLAHFGPFSF